MTLSVLNTSIIEHDNHNTCYLLQPSLGLVEVLCSYLKFNTKLFITCTQLYAQISQYNLQCCRDIHSVKLIRAMGRTMPTICLCIQYSKCNECSCNLMPAFIPTIACANMRPTVVCGTCPPKGYDWKTTHFELTEWGVHVTFTEEVNVESDNPRRILLYL